MINRLLRMSFLGFILFYCLFNLTSNCADLDLWGYLSFGRLFWQEQGFPYQDVFAYVPTRNLWVYHEWLTGVLYYPLFLHLGPASLQTLKYALALGTLFLVYLTAVRRGAHPVVAGLLTAVVAGGIKASYAPVRAQVFTYFFFALFLYVLEQARLRNRWRGLWLMPLILIPWCNLHGIGVLLLSGLATLINPYGLEYWRYIVRAVSMPRPFIDEWQSIFFHYQKDPQTFGIVIFFLVLLVGLGLFAMWRCRWREITSSLVLAVTLAMGLRHGRHLTFFFLAWGAYIPVCFNVQVNYLRSSQRLQNFGGRVPVKLAALVALTALSLLFATGFAKRQPFRLNVPASAASRLPFPYPVGAVKFIKEKGLSGNLLSIFDWGEYLMWHLYPQCRVGFDGRYETVYPHEVEKRYTEFQTAGTQWRQFLENYPPDLILLRPQAKITGLIREDPGWREIYEDEGCVLFGKKPPTPQPCEQERAPSGSASRDPALASVRSRGF
ncbi:MAG: hypothetical protein JRI66_12710 [Deltaproteobacteria bacterium]|nr:hypothetical protein [Deltaproteobacteria bacterium]